MSKITKAMCALLALAMLLTGAAFAETVALPAQGTLTVSNVTVFVNGDSITLNPTLKLGFAASEANGFLVDFAIDNNGEALLPMQFSFNPDSGLTALFTNANSAVRVPMSAITEALGGAEVGEALEQLSGMVEGSEAMTYFVQEFLPAFAEYMESAADPETADRMTAAVTDKLGELIGEGETTPEAFEVNGISYEGAAGSFTLNGAQLAALFDAEMHATEASSNYWEKYMTFMRLLMEESAYGEVPQAALDALDDPMGMLQKLGIGVSLEMDYVINDDGTAGIESGTLNVFRDDTAADPELSADAPDFEPMIINLDIEHAPDYQYATVAFDYEVEGERMTLYVTGLDTPDNKHMDMAMDLFDAEDGEIELTANVYIDQTIEPSGDKFDTVAYDFGGDNSGNFSFMFNGAEYTDGTGDGRLSFQVFDYDMGTVGVSFDCAYDAEAVEDLASAHDAYEIEKLDEEALNALQNDQQFMAVAMQIVGSLSQDAQKLASEDSIIALIEMINNANDYDEYDDYDYYEPEDDGELPFDLPEFTNLPEGWTFTYTDVDTAYDSATAEIANDAGDTVMYVYLNESYDDSVTYTMDENGLTPVEGRVVRVSGDPEYGYIDVSFNENGAYFGMYGYDEAADLEILSQILTGIQW